MVIDYLGEFIVYEELFINDKKIVLIHGGLKCFDSNKDLDDYSIWNRLDYNKIYYSNRYLVTGHTPTQSISGVNPGHVFKKNNHIVIDCGESYGGRLVAYCFETEEELYME